MPFFFNAATLQCAFCFYTHYFIFTQYYAKNLPFHIVKNCTERDDNIFTCKYSTSRSKRPALKLLLNYVKYSALHIGRLHFFIIYPQFTLNHYSLYRIFHTFGWVLKLFEKLNCNPRSRICKTKCDFCN